MGFEIATFGWIVASITSSTVIIILNKYIMEHYSFSSPTFLTAYHFFLTWGLLEVMCRSGAFERGTMPVFEKWKMAAFGSGAVIFMNLNLEFNSVGFYQLSKLCCVPFMVVWDFVVYHKTTNIFVLLSLAILLVGIGIFSINDVQLNLLGSIIAVIAVVCVSVFQIFTGSKQKEFNLNGPQLQHLTAFPQFVITLLAACVLETNPSSSTAIQNQRFDSTTIPLILLTGVIACSVNICSFCLIGRTSAVTYQVCGHMKSILIFIFGLVIFRNVLDTREQMIKKIIGLCISMFGCIWYTYLKLTQNKPTQQEKEKELNNDENPLLKDVQEDAVDNSK